VVHSGKGAGGTKELDKFKSVGGKHMGYIPKGAKWYLAEIVEQITVEDDPRIVVHTNMVLIHADSPEQAYEEASILGKQSDISYDNSEGKLVTIKFRGLHDLNVIYDKLEHGAELIYREDLVMYEQEIQSLVSAKKDLGVFAPIKPFQGPNYAAGDIMQELYEHSPHLKDGDDKKNQS
jgi:hypothetical protein